MECLHAEHLLCIAIIIILFFATAIIVGFQAPEYTFFEGDSSTVFAIRSDTSDDLFTVDVSARMFQCVN